VAAAPRGRRRARALGELKRRFAVLQHNDHQDLDNTPE
jgi:hypothetical protein